MKLEKYNSNSLKNDEEKLKEEIKIDTEICKEIPIDLIKSSEIVIELKSDTSRHNIQAMSLGKIFKLKKKIDNFKLLDDLKHIEDKADLSPFEPFILLFFESFSFLSRSQENKNYYNKIIKEYDNYFEFHNMMLLEHKIKILADIVFDTNTKDERSN